MTSQCLYDDGEETWTQKYNLGCGGVYLDDYINLDIMGVSALEHPELIAQNKTTITDYYARLDGDMHKLPKRRETVYDVIGDASHFMGMRETVDKIVAIQLFEHFTPINAIMALRRWRTALKHGAPLIISVPDMTGTLELIEQNNDIPFAIRHLRGRLGDKWNSHWAWYTANTLIELLEFVEFETVYQLPNFHFHPSIVIKAIKA